MPKNYMYANDTACTEWIINGVRMDKIYIQGVLEYTRSVVLNNILASAWTESHALDIGYADYSVSRTYNITSGHKYWIQNVTGGWGGKSGSCSWNYSTGYYTLNSATVTLTFRWTGSTDYGASAGWNGTQYMIVDVTEYESMLGRTITNEDMTKLGIFYGEKEVTL